MEWVDGSVGSGKNALRKGMGGVGSWGRGKTHFGRGWGGVEWVDGSVEGRIFLYDLGTETLYKTCFVNNSTQKASPEELQVRIFTIF